jgi:hypothetical protein
MIAHDRLARAWLCMALRFSALFAPLLGTRKKIWPEDLEIESEWFRLK